MAIDQNINLKIRNREKTIFEGIVNSITAVNDTGRFDILPQHSNFISLVNGILTYRTGGGIKNDIEVPNGVIKVEQNRIEVFLGFKR